MPKGIPDDPHENRLAVKVEDHPLEYIDFAGEIPSGQYGAGRVSIWDEGTYDEEKFRDDEVMVVLHGRRVSGRYVLFRTRGENWMIHRMDPPQDPGRETLPDWIPPMLAKLAADLPQDEERWGFEFKWDGIRALVRVDHGAVLARSRSGEEITHRYPELRRMGDSLGAEAVFLDGELIALDASGRPSFESLQRRIGLNKESEVRTAAATTPVYYMIFDVLHTGGRPTLALPYVERRRLLDSLPLSGSNWQVPPFHEDDGKAMLEASRQQRLEGVIAKRLDSQYEPGKRSGAWLKVKNHLQQELVIAGWLPGQGRRAGRIGALLVGYYENGRFRYGGKVGTGFSEEVLDRLAALLKPIERPDSPFETGPKPPRGAIFVEPRFVGEFEFSEWTSQGLLRHPSFKGLREDKPPSEVVRERAE